MLSTDLAQTRLAELFAPWIGGLGLRFEAVEKDRVLVRLPQSPNLSRIGGVVCGQALMAAADTAAVFACWSALGELRNVTTVSQNMQLMRAVAERDALLEARVPKAGRSLMFTEVTIRADGDERPAAIANSVFAVLPGSLPEPEAS